ncbi:MAG: hypothetical protein AABX82_07300 [Nanoarchaeota archaeon]
MTSLIDRENFGEYSCYCVSVRTGEISRELDTHPRYARIRNVLGREDFQKFKKRYEGLFPSEAERRSEITDAVYSSMNRNALTYREYSVFGILLEEKKLEFDVTGIPLQTWVSLNCFDKEIQVHLYTRRFTDLPREMRENEDPKKNAALYLPPEGVIWPVGRRCHGRFAIGCHKTERASRGVYVE